MPETVRAAVILFVDMPEDQASSSIDVAEFTRQGLAQAGFGMHKNTLPVQFHGKTLEVRIVDVMEAGMAIGNGYLWTQVTTKPFKQRGIYTDEQQAELDAEREWEKEQE